MATSKRTFWAMPAIGIAPGAKLAGRDPSHAEFIPGVQSCGITTNYNLEQIFELGQLSVYEDLEEVPNIEITIEKTIDQFNGLMARTMNNNGATADIVTHQNNECDVWFTVNLDTVKNAGDAAPLADVHCSGMFLSSYSANFVTDGFFTESATLVGNHKLWDSAGGTKMSGIPDADPGGANPLDTGVVKRRQNFYFATLPVVIDSLATADIAVNSATVSVDLGREEMNILGQRLPYHRFVTFPVEVSCEIELFVTDIKSLVGGQRLDALPNATNLVEEPISIIVETDTVSNVQTTGAGATLHTWDLGTKNKLQSITWGGGDTGGANSTMTLSYRNFNDLSYTGPANLNIT